ncbi:hypothetical protein CPS_2878 [Colwellia psychrerythraea 34H]|uniref:Uncharacterized protein n=1 Tax=Colwellia psychrerythraea (strain 34H / ATCC BAA-681) TaxID=167879 RepID=Q480D6_COLP3|nr:hypothetical protein CPS_2878 [Colwellia psychrerythraea 34H]
MYDLQLMKIKKAFVYIEYIKNNINQNIVNIL